MCSSDLPREWVIDQGIIARAVPTHRVMVLIHDCASFAALQALHLTGACCRNIMISARPPTSVRADMPLLHRLRNTTVKHKRRVKVKEIRLCRWENNVRVTYSPRFLDSIPPVVAADKSRRRE